MKSLDILKTFYRHLHWTNAHQTWRGGDSLWRASTHKLTQPVNICSGEVTQQIKYYIFTITRLMDTRFIRVVTYLQDLPLINSNDTSIQCSYKVTWEIKYTCKRQWTTKQKMCGLTEWEPYQLKTIWTFDHVTEVTWQFEEFIFPLSQGLWSVNLPGV